MVEVIYNYLTKYAIKTTKVFLKQFCTTAPVPKQSVTKQYFQVYLLKIL